MVNPSIGNVFARRLLETRKGRGLTRPQLAQLVTTLGAPASAQVIKKIEAGGERAANVSITELAALAAALAVYPVHLLAPLEDDVTVDVAVERTATAAEFRAWIRGQSVPRSWPITDDDKRSYVNQTPMSDLLETARVLLAVDAINEETYRETVDAIRGGDQAAPPDDVIPERRRELREWIDETRRRQQPKEDTDNA